VIASWSGTDRWPTKQVDLEQPNTGRMDDFLLFGGLSFATDRTAAQHVVKALPTFAEYVRDNRCFVHSALTHMLDAGIDQFLDLGAGMIPTEHGVHTLVHRINPAARVAYVETEPVCVAHAEVITRDDDRATVHPVDLFAPGWVLAPDMVWRSLDPGRPVGLLLTSVLHYQLIAERITTALRCYHDRLAPGSMLAVTHLTDDDPNRSTALQRAHAELQIPLRTRDRETVVELIRPWRALPDNPAVYSTIHAGAAVLARNETPSWL
jgi:S-adenosyl methyltransferase